MLADFRDYLKGTGLANVELRSTQGILQSTEGILTGNTLKADHYSIGKINNAQQKSIGIYSQNGFGRVEAFGLESSYDVAGVRILVHWNKNADETEIVSRILYDKLRYITNQPMGSSYVYMVEMTEGEPVFIGTDDNNVYEYHIGLLLYYKR